VRTVGKSWSALLVGAALLWALGGPAGASSMTTATKAQSATKAIEAAYATLFNLSNKNLAPKLAAVQSGAALQQALTVALASPLAASASGAKVQSVTKLSSSACAAAGLSSPCAKLTYSIQAKSGPALESGLKGYAVQVGGTWVVAKTTLCSLLSLFYEAEHQSGTPPGC
jgi:hypothetical protein